MAKYVPPRARGLRHLLQATSDSLKGLQATCSETAFRQALLLLLAGVPLGLCLSNTGIERALLIGSLLLVLIIELLNNALEAAVNWIGNEYHPLAGPVPKTWVPPPSL